MTGRLDVAPKTTEHNLIVRVGKSEAEVEVNAWTLVIAPLT